VLDGDSDLDPATNSRKVQPGRSGSGGHQMPIELGRVPAAGGCLLIWINDTWARSDLTSTPLATGVAWKWSRMITRVHRTPRQNNGRLADGRSADRHLRVHSRTASMLGVGGLGHAACPVIGDISKVQRERRRQVLISQVVTKTKWDAQVEEF
jgi:hypothetical protein